MIFARAFRYAAAVCFVIFPGVARARRGGGGGGGHGFSSSASSTYYGHHSIASSASPIATTSHAIEGIIGTGIAVAFGFCLTKLFGFCLTQLVDSSKLGFLSKWTGDYLGITLGSDTVRPNFPASNPGPHDIRLFDTKTFLRTLRHNDPHFNAEIFLERAQMTYMALARAKQHAQISEIRLLTAPVLADVIDTEIRNLADHRHALRFRNLNIRRATIEEVHLLPTRDEIIVHFDVVYARQVVNTDTGKRIKGSNADCGYGERWKFIRKRGTETAVTGGVLAKLCARCGAVLSLETLGVCEHCDAQIALGEVDWTVEAIAPVEYRTFDVFSCIVDPMDFTNGTHQLQLADQDFSADEFLKRVEMMFITLQQAWQDGNLETARAFMSQTLYMVWSMEIEAMRADNRKNVLENLQVLEKVPLSMERGVIYDRITLRIRARCNDYEIDTHTGKRTFSADAGTFSEVWTFQRKCGVLSVAQGIAHNICPNCGATLSVNNIGVCRYCDVVVTNGDFDWVVSRITQEDKLSLSGYVASSLAQQDDTANIADMSRSTLFFKSE